MTPRLAPIAILLSALLGACRTAPTLLFRAATEREHATTDVPAQALADLWVSYQIVIDAIDGEATHYRAEETCVYFKLTLPAGAHTLDLRLDYRSPTRHVRTEQALRLPVNLVPGQAYRLLDLGAQEQRQRSFTPHLLDGPPSDTQKSLGGS